jgi:predicted transcriptional regulator
MNVLKVGILSYEEMKARTIAIARGEFMPSQDEPKVFFTSLKSLANVLSEDNKLLLRMIKEHQPESISDLEKLTGRKTSNLCRTLHTMEKYGIVRLERNDAVSKRMSGRMPIKPIVIADSIDLKMTL